MTMTDSTRLVTAARLLRDGQSLRQVAQHLDITDAQVRDLVRDIPGLTIPDPTPAPATKPGDVVTDLPISALLAHPANIRTDLGDIDELADTIREHGILQPILVTAHPDSDDGRYIVLDGHRRLAAALVARHRHVPVVVRGYTSTAEAVAIMLVTGLQKAPLDPLDEARAYRDLQAAGYSQDDIAALVKKNQGHISQRLALLNLTPAEQEALRAGGITIRDAYHAGRDRSPGRKKDVTHNRPKPKNVLHFNKSHALARDAETLCRKAGHEVLLKLGPACGPCWEQAIRRDTIAALQDPA